MRIVLDFCLLLFDAFLSSILFDSSESEFFLFMYVEFAFGSDSVPCFSNYFHYFVSFLAVFCVFWYCVLEFIV